MKLPRLLLSIGLLAASTLPAPAQTITESPRAYRVLFVGNSLTYTNNLPALLRAVGDSQGIQITTETYAAPGGTLAERWRDGTVSEALRARTFDVVVLQEIGAQLGCIASASQQRKAPCAASIKAHEGFAELAMARGAKPLLFTTWARDGRMQGRINVGMRQLAKDTGAAVFNAAGAVAAMHKSKPEVTPYPDGIHPSTQASLMLAVALYRDITGSAPVAKDLRVTAALLPVNAAVSPDSPMESQRQVAGDGKVTLVPASLVEPLIKALPDAKSSIKMDPAARRR